MFLLILLLDLTVDRFFCPQTPYAIMVHLWISAYLLQLQMIAFYRHMFVISCRVSSFRGLLFTVYKFQRIVRDGQFLQVDIELRPLYEDVVGSCKCDEVVCFKMHFLVLFRWLWYENPSSVARVARPARHASMIKNVCNPKFPFLILRQGKMLALKNVWLKVLNTK